jgi:hypothetical protein
MLLSHTRIVSEDGCEAQVERAACISAHAQIYFADWTQRVTSSRTTPASSAATINGTSAPQLSPVAYNNNLQLNDAQNFQSKEHGMHNALVDLCVLPIPKLTQLSQALLKR